MAEGRRMTAAQCGRQAVVVRSRRRDPRVGAAGGGRADGGRGRRDDRRRARVRSGIRVGGRCGHRRRPRRGIELLGDEGAVRLRRLRFSRRARHGRSGRCLRVPPDGDVEGSFERLPVRFHLGRVDRARVPTAVWLEHVCNMRQRRRASRTVSVNRGPPERSARPGAGRRRAGTACGRQRVVSSSSVSAARAGRVSPDRTRGRSPAWSVTTARRDLEVPAARLGHSSRRAARQRRGTRRRPTPTRGHASGRRQQRQLPRPRATGLGGMLCEQPANRDLSAIPRRCLR
jgi:hypothetical protein